MFSPRFFKQSVTITRGTSTATASGGISRAASTLHESISASIQTNPNRSIGRFTMALATVQVLENPLVYTQTDVSNVRKEDRVTDDTTGAQYTVESVSDQAGQGKLWCIVVRTK